MSLRAIAAARRGNLALGWPADSVDNARVPSLSARAALPASHPAPSPYGSGLSAPLLNKGGFGGTPPMPPVRGSSAGSGWQLRPLYPPSRQLTTQAGVQRACPEPAEGAQRL